MPGAQNSGFDRIIDGKAVIRVIVRAHDKLSSAFENPVTVMGQMAKLKRLS